MCHGGRGGGTGVNPAGPEYQYGAVCTITVVKRERQPRLIQKEFIFDALRTRSTLEALALSGALGASFLRGPCGRAGGRAPPAPLMVLPLMLLPLMLLPLVLLLMLLQQGAAPSAAAATRRCSCCCCCCNKVLLLLLQQGAAAAATATAAAAATMCCFYYSHSHSHSCQPC